MDKLTRQHFAQLRDYVERSIHWRKGGTDRHAALKEALTDLKDAFDWKERCIEEWRDLCQSNEIQAEAARATARIAIRHLQAVLNECRTHDEQLKADTAARDWLISIGSEAGGKA